MHQQRFAAVVNALAIGAVLALAVPAAWAQTPPDNTKTNTQDRSPGAVTADQQKDNATDRDITAKIRRALMAEKSLSSYAHNVKIVAQHGEVTLKGPVRSADEKRIVKEKATEIAGADHVDDQITIAPGKTSSTK
jgi:hyperosmotically inducible periplasmic protein